MSKPNRRTCTSQLIFHQRGFKFVGERGKAHSFDSFSRHSRCSTGIVGFVTILQATWESTLLANYFGLFNGGTGGMIWCTIAVWPLMLCMIASMAEMASMAPAAGGKHSPNNLLSPKLTFIGQYHWVGKGTHDSLHI